MQFIKNINPFSRPPSPELDNLSSKEESEIKHHELDAKIQSVAQFSEIETKTTTPFLAHTKSSSSSETSVIDSEFDEYQSQFELVLNENEQKDPILKVGADVLNSRHALMLGREKLAELLIDSIEFVEKEEQNASSYSLRNTARTIVETASHFLSKVWLINRREAQTEHKINSLLLAIKQALDSSIESLQSLDTKIKEDPEFTTVFINSGKKIEKNVEFERFREIAIDIQEINEEKLLGKIEEELNFEKNSNLIDEKLAQETLDKAKENLLYVKESVEKLLKFIEDNREIKEETESHPLEIEELFSPEALQTLSSDPTFQEAASEEIQKRDLSPSEESEKTDLSSNDSWIYNEILSMGKKAIITIAQINYLKAYEMKGMKLIHYVDRLNPDQRQLFLALFSDYCDLKKNRIAFLAKEKLDLPPVSRINIGSALLDLKIEGERKDQNLVYLKGILKRYIQLINKKNA